MYFFLCPKAKIIFQRQPLIQYELVILTTILLVMANMDHQVAKNGQKLAI